jgi:hypothetical protein
LIKNHRLVSLPRRQDEGHDTHRPSAWDDRDANPHGHTLIVLSKFTTTHYAEALGPCPHLVFSWSLSLPSISAKHENKVAPHAVLGARRD